jgi:hypothetical protein
MVGFTLMIIIIIMDGGFFKGERKIDLNASILSGPLAPERGRHTKVTSCSFWEFLTPPPPRHASVTLGLPPPPPPLSVT